MTTTNTATAIAAKRKANMKEYDRKRNARPDVKAARSEYHRKKNACSDVNTAKAERVRQKRWREKAKAGPPQ